jgi:IPT/TIG domain
MRKILCVLALLAACSSLVAAPPVKLSDVKLSDFEKLPDDTVLDVGGRTMTKSAFLAEIRKASSASGAPLAVEAEKLKAKFVRDQKSRIEAANAAVVAKSTARANQLKAVPKPTLGAAQAQVPIVAAPPRITSIEPAAISPGTLFTIDGVGFDMQTKIFVTGTWGTFEVTYGSTLSWCVCGKLPLGLVASDQTITITLETEDGRRSQPFSAPFHPGRTQRCDVLHLGSVSWTSGPAGTCEYAGPSYERAVRCDHKASSNGYVSLGVDHVSMNPLKNGWGVDGYVLVVHPVGQASLQSDVSFTLGAPSMSANFTWAIANSNARTWWELLVCASGPDNGSEP